MSNHTPAPWVTFNYGGDTGDGPFEGFGVCQKGKSVAVMMGDPNGYVCDCPPSKYQKGNADLIAAAPELLEALKQARGFAEAVDSGIVSKKAALELLADIAPVIARAEGRT